MGKHGEQENKCAKSLFTLQIWSALPIDAWRIVVLIYISAQIPIFHSSEYSFLSLPSAFSFFPSLHPSPSPSPSTYLSSSLSLSPSLLQLTKIIKKGTNSSMHFSYRWRNHLFILLYWRGNGNTLKEIFKPPALLNDKRTSTATFMYVYIYFWPRLVIITDYLSVHVNLPYPSTMRLGLNQYIFASATPLPPPPPTPTLACGEIGIVRNRPGLNRIFAFCTKENTFIHGIPIAYGYLWCVRMCCSFNV